MQDSFFFDADKCIGCKACVMACKDNHNSPLGINFRRVYQVAQGEWIKKNGIQIPCGVSSCSLSFACSHCEEPACQKACPKKAIEKDERGAVWINWEKCVACRVCIKKCPQGAIAFNSKTHRPEKCDFCRERQEQGLRPACAAACPMRCMEVLSIEEILRRQQEDSTIFRFSGNTDTKPAFFIKPNRNVGKGAKGYRIRSMSEEL